jgi:hypothetical protein
MQNCRSPEQAAVEAAINQAMKTDQHLLWLTLIKELRTFMCHRM